MEEAEADRISQLPDAILQHILSFTDIKLAVQTTTLSTRWHNLWRSISDLNFTLTHLAAHSRVSLKNRQAAQDFSHRFTDFVSLFLSHRDYATAIRKLHLSFDSRHAHADAAFVEKCVSYAIRHGVQTLHLHALCRPALRFPDGFSACETLRELKLEQFGYGVYIPEQLSLPNLKTLYLENSVFINDGDFFSFSKEPFSRFPELEKLTLRRCTVYGIVISAPKLRVLEIIQDKLFCEVMEEISAPLLTSFRYEGCFPLECLKVDIPSLESVYLKVYRKAGVKNKWMPLKCVKMLQQLGNAVFVTLTLDTIKVLEMDRGLIEQSRPPFPNIKRLKLRKGRREIPTVLERVMNYLTEGSSCVVEFPEGVSMVEKNPEMLDEERELQLEQLFGTEDETQFGNLNFAAFQELLMPRFRQNGTFMF